MVVIREIKTFEDAVDSVLRELRETMVRKQHDYGPRTGVK